MPELIADLPATAILMPAALVYFLWALFHWIFKAEDTDTADIEQSQNQTPADQISKDPAEAPQGNIVGGHMANSNTMSRDWALLDLNDSSLPGTSGLVVLPQRLKPA